MVTDPLESLRDAGVLYWEALRPSDYAEVSALSDAVEHLDDTIVRHSMDELFAEVEHSSANPAELAVVAQSFEILVRAIDRAISTPPTSIPDPRPTTTDREKHP